MKEYERPKIKLGEFLTFLMNGLETVIILEEKGPRRKTTTLLDSTAYCNIIKRADEPRIALLLEREVQKFSDDSDLNILIWLTPEDEVLYL